jgi:hypothetical protein
MEAAEEAARMRTKTLKTSLAGIGVVAGSTRRAVGHSWLAEEERHPKTMVLESSR